MRKSTILLRKCGAMLLGMATVLSFDAYIQVALADGGVEVDPANCEGLPLPPPPSGTNGPECTARNPTCTPTRVYTSWMNYCCRDTAAGRCVQVQIRRQCCEVGRTHARGWAYRELAPDLSTTCDFNSWPGACS
ncbi:MAG: hypothetical protein ACR2HJ_12700 [Fimbriimonadales bacterium]